MTIPATIDDYPVRTVGGGFPPIFGNPNSSVTSVTIPDGVTRIGDYAFYRCTNLTGVSIPDGVTSLGVSAFYNCTSLTSVSIPFFTGVGVASFGDAFSHLVQVDRDFTVLSRNHDFVSSLAAEPAFVSAVATNESFLTALADKIIATLPDNYGIATKDDLDIVLSNTIARVQASPNSYSLYSAEQYEENRTNGQTDVTSDPSAFNLYTSNSIVDLRMDGVMVQKEGDAATVVFQPQITTNLATEPFTNSGTPITNTVSMPGDKGFLRIQAR